MIKSTEDRAYYYDKYMELKATLSEEFVKNRPYLREVIEVELKHLADEL